MHGLKQAAMIALNKIISHMKPHYYYPVLFTTGIWSHKTRIQNVYLCVGNCGVKYFNKNDADHLLESLKKYYAISTDWEGCNYMEFPKKGEEQ